MSQVLLHTIENTKNAEQTEFDRLIAAMTLFMAADSDAEAVAEIDRDLKRAA